MIMRIRNWILEREKLLIIAANQKICCNAIDNQRVETVDGKIICNDAMGKNRTENRELGRRTEQIFAKEKSDGDWESMKYLFGSC